MEKTCSKGEIIRMESEKQSFEHYFTAHYKRAYGFIQKKVNDPYLAEDLVMEAFLSCYQKFDQFDPQKASFQTWLYVVINNKLKNYYRDHKEHDDIDECMNFIDTFEDDLIAAESLRNMRNELANALESLSEPQKSIVIMKYFKNMQAKEIGEKLGLTYGNVRVHLTRALNKLRGYFESHGIEWEI